MNIHEHQAKQILKKYGANVPEGIFALTVDELVEKAKSNLVYLSRIVDRSVSSPKLAGWTMFFRLYLVPIL